MFGNVNSTLLNLIKKDRYLKYLSFSLVILGVTIRLIQYFHNRSLWFDEVNLALNIVERDYGELTQTLEHNQAAPLGFLWVEKLAIQVFGNNEYALRLFPLVANTVALGVFYRLVTRYLTPLAVPVAITLFAFGRHTLYFATELKQYSSDIAIALILFWFLTSIAHKILHLPKIIAAAVLGSLAIWFSHPAIFMLGGLEGYYLLMARGKYRLQILVNRLGIYLAWLISFGLFYFLTIANTMSNQDLADSWSSRYPSSLIDIGWLLDALGRFFYNPMGFTGITDGIGIFAFIFGCIAWYGKNKAFLGALLAPFAATIIAAYLHQYPFRERLVVFLVPLGIVIVSEGVAWLLARFRDRDRLKRGTVLGILGLVCLIGLTLPQLTRASGFAVAPELKHEIRPVTEYVLSHQQPGDTIYVYSLGAQGFSYYAQRLGYSKEDYILGLGNLTHKDKEMSQNWHELKQDIRALKGKSRVWVIIRAEDPEKTAILAYLTQFGREINIFEQPGASAHLFNFKRSPK